MNSSSSWSQESFRFLFLFELGVVGLAFDANACVSRVLWVLVGLESAALEVLFTPPKIPDRRDNGVA